MSAAVPYEPATLSVLADWLHASRPDEEWLHVREFLNEYWNERPEDRERLLIDEPSPTGSPQWDVFLAALAEHLATKARRMPPAWVHSRTLRTAWFPFNTPAARAEAFVHAPAAFRKHGIFVAYYELEVA